MHSHSRNAIKSRLRFIPSNVKQTIVVMQPDVVSERNEREINMEIHGLSESYIPKHITQLLGRQPACSSKLTSLVQGYKALYLFFPFHLFAFLAGTRP